MIINSTCHNYFIILLLYFFIMASHHHNPSISVGFEDDRSHPSIRLYRQLPQSQLIQKKSQKNPRFVTKFKFNQFQLRQKFQNYILQEKHKYPLILKRSSDDFFEKLSQKSFQNLRQIQQQKKTFAQQLRRSLNDKKYHEHQKQQHQKTFKLLKQKIDKVEKIRKQHRYEQIQLEHDLKNIGKSAMQQKKKLQNSVISSRVKIAKSRLENSQRKFSLANQTRGLKQIFRDRISQEKLTIFKDKQSRYKTVKSLQKNTSLNVSKAFEQKHKQAEQVRINRLFQEFAAKQEVRIQSNLQRQETNEKVEELKTNIIYLEGKINDFRTRLGQRMFGSSSKFESRVQPKYKNRSFTEQRQQISTNSQFFTGIRYKNQMDETFQ